MSKRQPFRTRWRRQATWDHSNVSNKHVFGTFGKTLKKWSKLCNYDDRCAHYLAFPKQYLNRRGIVPNADFLTETDDPLDHHISIFHGLFLKPSMS
ncbi:hypothetical protein VNO78_04576 [Psophocarpus tetragonolobus]|uniref:Uncharacterized protein n=1 Tax=Psophocarpus tetragonolobus TaxID=3891 RepID=A0AAN9TF10_PSOTE